MSGIDEIGNRGIPQCPDCGDKTRYWILRDRSDVDMGYLNYNYEFAKDNKEFNIERPMQEVMASTTKMVCSSCKYKASEELLKEGLGALYKDIRRYPNLVRDR